MDVATVSTTHRIRGADLLREVREGGVREERHVAQELVADLTERWGTFGASGFLVVGFPPYTSYTSSQPKVVDR